MFGQRALPGAQLIRKGAAGGKFQRNIVVAVGLIRFKDTNDVGMLKIDPVFAFVDEACEVDGDVRKFRRQYFERHRRIRTRFVGGAPCRSVDDGHATAPNFFV